VTNSRLGTWRNPPLCYVVAELAISPYYSMQAAIPRLQDALRKAYPRTLEGQELVVEAKPSAQPFWPVWRLVSADQQYGVQLGTRAISLHVTSYLHSSDFLARWAELLDSVSAANLGAYIERAGLRYVDLIVPSEKHSPADYLAHGLKGVTPEGAKPVGSMWAASFQFDGALVNVRTAAPAPKGVLLPPDFNALPLQKPKIMVEAEKRMKDELPIGFVDTDCGREVNQIFNSGQLVDIYGGMQKLASRTFSALLSEIAKGEWH